MKKIVEVWKNSGLKFFDFIAVTLLLTFAGALFLYNTEARVDSSGLVCVITRNLKEIERFDLESDRLIKLEDYGVISVKSKAVRLLHANCKDQICVHTREISKEGESIICLPNRLIVELRKDERE